MGFGDISTFRRVTSSLGEIVALGFFSLAGGLRTLNYQNLVSKDNLKSKLPFLSWRNLNLPELIAL